MICPTCQIEMVPLEGTVTSNLACLQCGLLRLWGCFVRKHPGFMVYWHEANFVRSALCVLWRNGHLTELPILPYSVTEAQLQAILMLK